MSQRLLFFATKNDMISLLEGITDSEGTRIVYVKTGDSNDDSLSVFSSIENIPDLGILNSPNHCIDSYLIMYHNEKIVTEKFVLKSDKKITAVYPTNNINSIVFAPSGFYKNNPCLIHGQFSTMQSNVIVKRLLGEIKKRIKKQFTNVHGWYIGPEAITLYGKVRFVTISADEPVEYDLKIT